MSKAGKRLIAAAEEMVAVARGEAEPALLTSFTRWRPIGDADCVSGRPFVGMDTETGEMRLTWWGKTSHVPLYGWCHGDDPENIDLWSPTIVLPIPPPPAPIHPETGED